MRALTIVLSVCVAFFMMPFRISLAEGGKTCLVDMIIKDEREEITEIDFNASSDNGICAVFGVVCYDVETLILLSAGTECKNANFSFLDMGGEIRFIVDSSENNMQISVSMFFGRVSDGSGAAEVSISHAEACCVSGGDIIECDVNVSTANVKIQMKNETDKLCPLPTLKSYQIKDRGEKTVLSVSILAEKKHFAAGVEVFFIFQDGSGKKVFVVKIIKPSCRGDLEIEVPSNELDWFAAVITPIAFDQAGCTKGEKSVAVNQTQVSTKKQRLK